MAPRVRAQLRILNAEPQRARFWSGDKQVTSREEERTHLVVVPAFLEEVIFSTGVHKPLENDVR